MHSSQPVHFNLVAAAHATMIEHGFQPDFPAGVDTELSAIKCHPEPPAALGAQDLRGLLWSWGLAAVSVTCFVGELRQRRWRFGPEVLLAAMIAALLYTYWP